MREHTMSKMDGLRAMREARYAENAARAKTPASTSQPAVKKAAAKKTPAPKTSEPASAPAETVEEALCGHRNMSGRTCTREHNHAAKSHRYS